MKVKLKRAIGIGNDVVKKGVEFDIDDKTGQNWVDAGYAEEVKENNAFNADLSQQNDSSEQTLDEGENNAADTNGGASNEQNNVDDNAADEQSANKYDFDAMSVAEMKAECKKLGMKNYSDLNREALIELLSKVGA